MPAFEVLKPAIDQPVIQYKIPKCRCGLCAPKAKNLDTYKSIMKKYQKDYIA
jgi:hypothetical protein